MEKNLKKCVCVCINRFVVHQKQNIVNNYTSIKKIVNFKKLGDTTCKPGLPAYFEKKKKGDFWTHGARFQQNSKQAGRRLAAGTPQCRRSQDQGGQSLAPITVSALCVFLY